MTVIKMPENPCPFCKRNEATQLCDFVIDYVWTTAKDGRGRMIGPMHFTCDNQICRECVTNQGGHEFCPSCKELHEMVKKNHKKVGKVWTGDLLTHR